MCSSSGSVKSLGPTLLAAIEEIMDVWPAYGYRWATQDLRRRGTVANHKRAARIMREEALIPHRIRKFLVTTESDHAELICSSLVPRRIQDQNKVLLFF